MSNCVERAIVQRVHFYVKYKELINEMKSLVDESFGRDNAGFTGFLMMTMRD